MNDTTVHGRAKLRQHPERAVPAEAAEILGAGIVAHVGFAEQDQPYVIPMAYHYDRGAPHTLYLHGGPGSRLLRHLARGAPVAVAVTLADGLIYSRTALYHSVNYRSVVAFGRAAPLLDRATGAAVLEAMIARYFPGRAAGRDYAAAPPEHLDATSVVVVEIEEWSTKARRGGPTGPLDNEPGAPGSAGVLQLPRLCDDNLQTGGRAMPELFMLPTKPPFSLVTEWPAAAPEVANGHFVGKLSVETDPADVHLDLERGADEFVLVDARNQEAYAEGHIPGAISLPYRTITTETTADLSKDSLVVTYCWSPACTSAAKAATRLSALGFRVKEMIGGIEYWRKEGYPLEGTSPADARP